MSPSDFIIERHNLPQELWVVFTGCDSEGPDLRAIFFNEGDARAYCRAKHPDPEEEGCALAFGADAVPGCMAGGSLLVGNDFQLDTHDALMAALAAGATPSDD